MTARILHAGPGAAESSVGTARGAPEHRVVTLSACPAVQRRAGHRVPARWTPVPVREQLVADPAHQHRQAADREPSHLSGASSANSSPPTRWPLRVGSSRTCDIRESTVNTPLWGGSPGLRSPPRSHRLGSRACTAPSTASCSVTATTGTRGSCPAAAAAPRRRRSHPTSSTSPPWDPRYGRRCRAPSGRGSRRRADAVRRPAARSTPVRLPREFVPSPGPRCYRQHPPERLTVEVPTSRTSCSARSRATDRPPTWHPQCLDPIAGLSPTIGSGVSYRVSSCTDAIRHLLPGHRLCRRVQFFEGLAVARYMWTPQGRHGRSCARCA